MPGLGLGLGLNKPTGAAPGGVAGSTPITTYPLLEAFLDGEGETYPRFEAYLDATGQDYTDLEAGNITEEALSAWFAANP